MKRGSVSGLAAVLPIVLLLAAAASSAAAEQSADNTPACFACHGKKGVMITFENGDSLEAYVDAVSFRRSVHGALSCTECHSDFSPGDHSKRRFKSREHYLLRSSIGCKRCHRIEQLARQTVHAAFAADEARGKATLCTHCHRPHEIMKTTRKSAESEEQFCLRCHGRKITMSFRNGENIPVQFDGAVLDKSVHKKLACSDCHFGFSSSEHPRRSFRTPRDLAVANAEACRRCHFDKYAKTSESIHFTLFSGGNLHAPVCTDCHGSHGIQDLKNDRVTIAERCRNCHRRVYETYAKSVHGRDLLSGFSRDVPVCTDCHTAHDIRDPLTVDYRERIPELCSGCHGDKALASRYGLSTNVVRSYLADFHGVTLNLYRKERGAQGTPKRLVAVCTDCHGTHNIMSMKMTDRATVKASLAKRCGGCHDNAPADFPDAWISHYEPNFRSSPLIFVVQGFYRIFIALAVAGMLLQIVFQLWRFAYKR